MAQVLDFILHSGRELRSDPPLAFDHGWHEKPTRGLDCEEMKKGIVILRE
jgi:hypothetical protein